MKLIEKGGQRLSKEYNNYIKGDGTMVTQAILLLSGSSSYLSIYLFSILFSILSNIILSYYSSLPLLSFYHLAIHLSRW